MTLATHKSYTIPPHMADSMYTLPRRHMCMGTHLMHIVLWSMSWGEMKALNSPNSYIIPPHKAVSIHTHQKTHSPQGAHINTYTLPYGVCRWLLTSHTPFLPTRQTQCTHSQEDMCMGAHLMHTALWGMSLRGNEGIKLHTSHALSFLPRCII